jgi:hypothetical protein
MSFLKDPLSAIKSPKLASSSSSASKSPSSSASRSSSSRSSSSGSRSGSSSSSSSQAIQSLDGSNAVEAIKELATAVVGPDDAEDAARAFGQRVLDRHADGTQDVGDVTDSEARHFFEGYQAAGAAASSSSPSGSGSSSTSSASDHRANWEKGSESRDPKHEALHRLAKNIAGAPGGLEPLD